MFSAVIYTAGRTGSQLIFRNLVSRFKTVGRDDFNNDFNYGVVSTHNPLYLPPTDDFICIISKRKNLFNEIISSLTAKRTNEFVQYSNKEINLFSISDIEFKNTFLFHKAYYEIINKNYFKKVLEINYEDLINDPKYLFSLFGLPYLTEYDLKSPYDYYKLVENMNELKNIYDLLEQTPITQREIDVVKSSITLDLHDIRVNHNGNRFLN